MITAITPVDQIKSRWVGASCTLNGKPAKVMGRAHRFATIGTLDGTMSAEWSWQTVDAIMKRTKSFQM